MNDRLPIAALLLHARAQKNALSAISEAMVDDALRVADLLILRDLLSRPRGRPVCPKCNAVLPDHVPDCALYVRPDYR